MNRSRQMEALIKELAPAADMPPSTGEKWRMLRGLVNAREPLPVSAEFLATQDELLQSLIAEKGITDIDDLKPGRDGLYLWRGDIVTLKVGAIVNAANSALLGCFVPNHACIDNAIHTYAGVQLRMACAALMADQGHLEPVGSAKITAAYNLPSEHILHTVGPMISAEPTDEHRRQLASCYRSCLALADRNNIESVAFCCISTGEFRFPHEEAGRIAVRTVTDCLRPDSNVKKVLFNVFTDQDERIYRELLA